MKNLVPLPPQPAPARRPLTASLIPSPMREKDGNALRAQAAKLKTFAGTTALYVTGSGGLALAAHGAAMTAIISAGICTFATGVFVLFTPRKDRTPEMPVGVDPLSLSRLLRETSRIAREGLNDRDRAHAQDLVDQASEQVRHLIGADAWTVAVDPENTGAGIYIGGRKITGPNRPETLGQKAVVLDDVVPTIDKLALPGGTEPNEITVALSWAVPRIASICEDFGLDPSGFAERTRVLPGMRTRAIEALPALDATARRLSEEWLSGDREGVDPMLRIDADRAAGPELETLSRAWERARASSTPDTMEAIDADMREGCRRICATLSAAIGARARSDRDALGTQARFLSAKHGIDR